MDEYLNKLTIAENPTEEEIKIALRHSTIQITETSVKIRNEQRIKKGLSPLTLEEWLNELDK